MKIFLLHSFVASVSAGPDIYAETASENAIQLNIPVGFTVSALLSHFTYVRPKNGIPVAEAIEFRIPLKVQRLCSDS